MRLKTLRKLAEETQDTFGDGAIMDFTREICEERQRMMERTGKTVQQLERTSNTKEKLSIFNGNRENWHCSKRDLTVYLNQIKNNSGLPIYYVIRDPEQEERYRADNGDLGQRIYEAPFRGRTYKADAFQVLQTLRQWTSGGLAKTFVGNNKDVQDAWAKLIRNSEGHDARGANIQRARETLNTANWSKNSYNFTFDDYCNKHMKANREVDQYQANVVKESQVNLFLKGIRADIQLNPY
jgi:hypothetical protein